MPSGTTKEGFFEEISIHNTAVVAAGDGGRTDCAGEAAGEAEDAEGAGGGREGEEGSGARRARSAGKGARRCRSSASESEW